MEPRARAGNNVGKMNISHNELAQLLFAYGDVKSPLPETVRVLDEILTDFMQSIAFEATLFDLRLAPPPPHSVLAFRSGSGASF
ncbi:hypothetical protein G6O67_002540 [Ophiocordyceps sinensis]|uniref:Uncharacterized protein n=1 Tax=Ophiocordyceps sinensis TaxID=72228 RepID=A0A8H4V7N5_9HYPO|nr:hypothetical protein G6O67_002540 [Ophiocordyceps sinensis]